MNASISDPRDVYRIRSRRRFLNRLALGAGAAVAASWFYVPGAFAEELLRTPRMTPGPFYPDHLPLDTDNDLLILNDSLTPAVGEITQLTGRILDARGEPVRNATIEIWQVDGNGVYLHSHSGPPEKRDRNFQGFGRFLTGRSGEYYFRTVKPVPYPGRTPHIHFAVKTKGQDDFITQCFIKGHPQNVRDGVLNEIRDERARQSVQVDFTPIPDSKTGELAARFDVVLGFTPGA